MSRTATAGIGRTPTEVQRYESGMFKHLEMNMVMSGPSGDLEYLTGTNEGFITEQYTGRVRPQGQLIYRPVNAKAGQTDTAGFVLQPRQYDSFYNLGELKGVDEQRLSEALNNYGRMMILDYDMARRWKTPTYSRRFPHSNSTGTPTSWAFCGTTARCCLR